MNIIPRLYVKGTVLGYQRSREVTHPNHALIRLQAVKCREDAKWYVGKRVGYFYKGAPKKDGNRIRVRWGKITHLHGNSGVVRAKFKRNITTKSFAKSVRVFMYPSAK